MATASVAKATVLVVNNETPILNVTRDMLVASSYDAFTADCAPTAIDILRRHLHIDLLLTEAVLQGMSGQKSVGRRTAARHNRRCGISGPVRNGGAMLYPSASPAVIAGVTGVFIAMLVLLEAGRRIGMRDYAKHPENAGKGLGPLEGAVFGLMGLMIAFTFSGAGSRFDAKRRLIADEANAIGTAYLRLNLLPAGAQPKLRESFRQYLDSRLDFYRSLADDAAAAKVANDRAASLQDGIWNQAVEATRQVSREANANAITSLVLQSLNEMIDITTTRTVALRLHPPAPVYWMLVVLVLSCSLLAGYQSAARKTRSWVHVLGFAVIVAVSILLILDYEYPRTGLIRIDPTDQVLIDLRNRMR